MLYSKSSSKWWSKPESMNRLWTGLVELMGRHWEPDGGTGSSNLGQFGSGTGDDVSYLRDSKVNSWCALQTVWSFCKISHSGFSRVCSKRATEVLKVCNCVNFWLASANAHLTLASSSRKFCEEIKFDNFKSDHAGESVTLITASSRNRRSLDVSTADRARVLYDDSCDIKRVFSFSKHSTRACSSSIFLALSNAVIWWKWQTIIFQHRLLRPHNHFTL